MIKKITYTDKEYLINDNTVPDKNKVLDTDMNEIKEAVNNNADELYTAKENIQTNEQDISEIKTKLNTIEQGAQVNKIENIKVNGTTLPITEKTVNVSVPTKTNELENNSGFITKDVNNLTNYTKTENMNTAINNAVEGEATIRQNADNNLQNQIDAITVSTDVVDIVGTYQELLNYDTQHIKANDVIKVLQDNTHSNAMSYYRWIVTGNIGAWDYIGSEGPFYTKGETDTLLNTKQNKIDSSHKLNSDLVDDTNQINKFMTQAEKEKLQGIEAEANKTIVDDELDDTSTNPVENKVITEHLEKLQTENTRLKGTLKTTEGEGENITLDKTAEMDFKTPPLPRGNTKQDSYSGKNKASISNYDYANGRSVIIPTPILPIGTYTISFKVDSFIDAANSGNIAISCGGVDTSVVYFGNMVAGQIFSKTITTTGEATQFSLRIGQSVYDAGNRAVLSNIQLEEGSTATEYEKYVGGYASPNIDYPQNVYNLTGDVEVKVENKNLFNKTTATQNALLNASGQIVSQPGVSDENGFISDYIFLKAGVNYYNNTRGYSNAGFYDLNKTFIERTTLNQSAIVTVLNDCYVRLNGKMGYLDTFQLEKITTATTYTPHQEQTFIFPLGTERMYLGDYLADDGIHHVRKQVTISGTTITLNDAKNNGIYLCNKKTEGNLSGKILSFDEAVTDAIIEYELDEEEITPYTTAQQTVYNAIKESLSYEGQTNISGSSNEANPLFEVVAVRDMSDFNPDELLEIKQAIVALGGVI